MQLHFQENLKFSFGTLVTLQTFATIEHFSPNHAILFMFRNTSNSEYFEIIDSFDNFAWIWALYIF